MTSRDDCREYNGNSRTESSTHSVIILHILRLGHQKERQFNLRRKKCWTRFCIIQNGWQDWIIYHYLIHSGFGKLPLRNYKLQSADKSTLEFHCISTSEFLKVYATYDHFFGVPELQSRNSNTWNKRTALNIDNRNWLACRNTTLYVLYVFFADTDQQIMSAKSKR